ncbi:acid phosphatase [Aureococcus anophagefferens]|nr:acid phosphatase [Aureococcus anophagefferens]
MRVTWVTMVKNDGGGAVLYGKAGDERSTAAGSSYSYEKDNFTGTLHSAVLDGLRDGCQYGTSSRRRGAVVAGARVPVREGATELSLLAYGDMGVINSAGTIKVADALASSGRYDLRTSATRATRAASASGNNSWVFDEHFRNIQGHVSTMPFMTVPGNHEAQYDYAPYVNRLPMRGWLARRQLAPFYSVRLRPAHFIAYSSEEGHSLKKDSEQWRFIAADLEAANENRAARPWIVAFTHHPMYCSDLITESTRCRKEAFAYRRDLEDLFHEHKLDLHISGHNHRRAVRRRLRVRRKGKCELSAETHNHTLPIYIVNGAGGDTEGIDPTWVPEFLAPFRAFHASGLRTGLATVDLNLTHLVWRFQYTGRGAWPTRVLRSRDDRRQARCSRAT